MQQTDLPEHLVPITCWGEVYAIAKGMSYLETWRLLKELTHAYGTQSLLFEKSAAYPGAELEIQLVRVWPLRKNMLHVLNEAMCIVQRHYLFDVEGIAEFNFTNGEPSAIETIYIDARDTHLTEGEPL